MGDMDIVSPIRIGGIAKNKKNQLEIKQGAWFDCVSVGSYDPVIAGSLIRVGYSAENNTPSRD